MNSTRVSLETHAKIRRVIERGLATVLEHTSTSTAKTTTTNNGRQQHQQQDFTQPVSSLAAATMAAPTYTQRRHHRQPYRQPNKGNSTLLTVAGLTDVLLFPKSDQSSPSDVLDTALELPIMPLKVDGMRNNVEAKRRRRAKFSSFNKFVLFKRPSQKCRKGARHT